LSRDASPCLQRARQNQQRRVDPGNHQQRDAAAEPQKTPVLAFAPVHRQEHRQQRMLERVLETGCREVGEGGGGRENEYAKYRGRGRGRNRAHVDRHRGERQQHVEGNRREVRLPRDEVRHRDEQHPEWMREALDPLVDVPSHAVAVDQVVHGPERDVRVITDPGGADEFGAEDDDGRGHHVRGGCRTKENKARVGLWCVDQACRIPYDTAQ
jgi:hypothetical protein